MANRTPDTCTDDLTRYATEAELERTVKEFVERQGGRCHFPLQDGTIEETRKSGRAVGAAARMAARHWRSHDVATVSSQHRKDKRVRISPAQIMFGCATCGTPVYVFPSQARYHVRHFCNRECQQAYQRPIEERFWEKVEVLPNGCWRWRGADKRAEPRNQYGRLNLGRNGEGFIGAHVFSYQLHKGPVPDGLQLDHLCRHPWCVNPDHLEPVTSEENVRRAAPHQSGACKNGHPRTPENTAYRADGRVHHCRVCQRERRRATR